MKWNYIRVTFEKAIFLMVFSICDITFFGFRGIIIIEILQNFRPNVQQRSMEVILEWKAVETL